VETPGREKARLELTQVATVGMGMDIYNQLWNSSFKIAGLGAREDSHHRSPHYPRPSIVRVQSFRVQSLVAVLGGN
jgi:hypothetical protein